LLQRQQRVESDLSRRTETVVTHIDADASSPAGSAAALRRDAAGALENSSRIVPQEAVIRAKPGWSTTMPTAEYQCRRATAT
jgi:hypothetical protein